MIVPSAYESQLQSPVFPYITGMMRAAVMVGDISAMPCASSSAKPRQFFLSVASYMGVVPSCARELVVIPWASSSEVFRIASRRSRRIGLQFFRPRWSSRWLRKAKKPVKMPALHRSRKNGRIARPPLHVDKSEVQRNLQRTSCRQPLPNAASYGRVAPKTNSCFRIPIATERLEGLLAELRLFLVDRGHTTTIAD